MFKYIGALSSFAPWQKNPACGPALKAHYTDQTELNSPFFPGDFNVLTLYIHLHRRFEFYLTHNYIPAILIVIISWLSLWVDRDCAPARVGMGIATILTMTTLLIGTSQQGLPVVSYIKALDWYYIGCFIFVFVGLCEYSLVNYFSTKHNRLLEQQRLKAVLSTLEKVRNVKL